MRHLFYSALVLLLLIPAASRAADEKFLDIQEITSDQGLTAWLVEDHTLPVVALKFSYIGAGSRNDPEDKQGLALMLSNTMDEGAGPYDSQSFQKALTDHSITLRFGSDRDNFSGTLKTLTRHKEKAFELLQLALNAPRFDEEPVERMRAANLARIRSSLSDPDWIAARIMNDRAFEGEPYALNSGGTLTTLNNITADDLRTYKASQLTRDRLKIAVTGDITPDELKTVLDTLWGGPEIVSRLEPEAQPFTVKNGGTSALYEKDIPQTIIRIIQPGISRNDPDYYPALLMDFILGGSGFGSRLTEEIREKRGLTYGIHTGFYELDQVKGYSLTTSTKNETAGEMMALIKAEMTKMRDGTAPVTEKELKDAQSYLTGSMPLSLSSTGQIAGMVLGLQLDRLPIDYLDRHAASINAVTIDDIARVSKRLLAPENLTVVMVGKPENVNPTQTIESLPHVE